MNIGKERELREKKAVEERPGKKERKKKIYEREEKTDLVTTAKAVGSLNFSVLFPCFSSSPFPPRLFV